MIKTRMHKCRTHERYCRREENDKNVERDQPSIVTIIISGHYDGLEN